MMVSFSHNNDAGKRRETGITFSFHTSSNVMSGGSSGWLYRTRYCQGQSPRRAAESCTEAPAVAVATGMTLASVALSMLAVSSCTRAGHRPSPRAWCAVLLRVLLRSVQRMRLGLRLQSRADSQRVSCFSRDGKPSSLRLCAGNVRAPWILWGGKSVLIPAALFFVGGFE